KIIKLTATTKIKNVIANGCKKLEELDLAENPNIEVIDVSETGLKEIDATNCEKLAKLICSSCDIDQTGLILTGCAKLVYLDFSNNSFLIFDYSATDTPILETLKCEGQNKAVDNIPSEFNFSIFMSADKSNVVENISASDEDTSYAANIKNLTAKDVNGNPIEVISQDLSTGYVKLSSPASTLSYDYVTGFKDVNMGVTINAGNSKSVTIGNSGGGCNLGLSGLALIAFAIMLKKLR
ncbi:MAG: hypothetical protein IJQ57_11810, partial [Synergistaceae bacterium]|nr:hypothetical protein [Synergistaceae bacterium]